MQGESAIPVSPLFSQGSSLSGSVESTHKQCKDHATSHYHTKHCVKHCYAVVASLGGNGGLTHRRGLSSLYQGSGPTPWPCTCRSVPPTQPTALRRPLRPAASSPAVRSRLQRQLPYPLAWAPRARLTCRCAATNNIQPRDHLTAALHARVVEVGGWTDGATVG